MTCPNHAKFLSLDTCQKRFLCIHKEVGLTPHPVVGLVLQVEDTEKFPLAPDLESLGPFFFKSQQAGSMFHSHRGDKRLVRVELACEADGVAPPDPV